jgi:hypothetical protein
VGEHDNPVLTGRYRRVDDDIYAPVDDDIDIDDHRSLHPDLDGAGAGSYAPYVSYGDLPKITVYIYDNGHLLPDVFHAPDAHFDYTEWESKYMLKPTFADLDRYHKWGYDNEPTDSTFTPIVNEHQIVIGHVGFAMATNIVVPSSVGPNFPWSKREPLTWGLLDERVSKYLAEGGIAYVGAAEFNQPQFRKLEWVDRDACLVVVDPNGQVLQLVKVVTKETKDPWEVFSQDLGTLLDVLFVLDLAAFGIRVGLIALAGVRSASKLAGRRILALILRTGAKEAESAALDAELELAFGDGAILQRGARGGFPVLDKLPGLSAGERTAASNLLGQKFSRELQAAWNACSNAQAVAELAEVQRLLGTGLAADREAAYALSERLYGNWRDRFWTRVRGDSKLKDIFTNAGAKFDKGGAPYFDIGGGKTKNLTITLDHFVERRVDNPARAVDALNVRPSISFENSATLEAIRQDNFLKGWKSPTDP